MASGVSKSRLVFFLARVLEIHAESRWRHHMAPAVYNLYLTTFLPKIVKSFLFASYIRGSFRATALDTQIVVVC